MSMVMHLQAVQPRVHPARQDIGQGVSGENKQGGKQRNTQQQGCIAARAGFHGGLSKSGIGKYGFGQNRSAKQFTRVGKMQGQCRQCAVAQSVAPCAAPAAHRRPARPAARPQAARHLTHHSPCPCPPSPVAMFHQCAESSATDTYKNMITSTAGASLFLRANFYCLFGLTPAGTAARNMCGMAIRRCR